ncbi:Sterile alpha motif domain containing protein 3 [Dissostichus eleginoides]|uniref:Sterile alpha motif domain containing protein 3 n=1 Tax=Dissostichus eleginoides TaxID=100907 RepID=A0AAD9B684_DISEL|nr:Sterile alpha motif domain containing protein 3 [Dissostichus eleginoides]
MVAYLFEGSFKKQAKFLQFARQLKEPEPTTILTFEILPNDCLSPTCQEYGRFPAVFTLPTFPKDIQTKLDAKQPCHKVSTDRHKIVRILHETMAQYTMYPTNSEYIKVAKALIFRYPFLKDMEGNGYSTWHMSLKRQFKAERTLLVHHEVVRNMKQKFGHHRSPQAPENNQGSITTSVRRSSDIISVSGEDESSIDAHTQVLKRQYLKAQPDSCIVTNAMTKTFQWRRKEVAEGVRADTIANKYPFLKTPAGLCEEMNRIHNIENLQHRFREEFLPILPKVLALAKGKSPLEKIYLQAREESLSEDLPAMDFKAGLVLLPIIFKEKVEHHVTLEEPGTPYPTTQMTHTDWKSAFTSRGPSVVKTDGFELCRASDLEEGVLAAFCAYFVFNMAYPPNRKRTLTFVQRCILKISKEGDKPLSTTVIRILNQLY